jgi:hypothetical protein
VMAPDGSADAIVDIARKGGLIGVWKPDCDPAAGYWASNFVVHDGKLFSETDYGKSKVSDPVLSAHVSDDGLVVLTIRLDDFHETHQMALRKQDTDHYRVIWNKNVDTGKYTVRDGEYDTGGKTVSFTRCR